MKPTALSFTWRTGLLAGILLGLLLVWALFDGQLNRRLAAHLLLNSKSPRDEFFDELARQSDDPVGFLNRCWATGKVTHRQLVAVFLKNNATTHSPWFVRAEPLVLSGTTDADVSVRELALEECQGEVARS